MTQPTWIGRTLSNRYRIDALLGQGGMSAVYKATDPNLRRTVAIKMIHPHLSGDPQFVNRFQEEAAAVAALNHPNIVQVYDFNNDNGVYYMVLSFIEGGTLQDLLNKLNRENRHLDIQKAIKYTIDVCDGLGYAHQRGMIHRDIKPANIMIDHHDEAILADFGIVKIVGSQGHTATGAVVGTARYMPPELVQSEKPDERADIYSLGVTLFEMLSGRPPFVADSAITLMMMHLNEPVP
ncbi:MAG: protein kinase, partial [Anaerolineales bacterium]